MKYKQLGNTGLKVSRIALGCLSFGEVSQGGYSWVLNDEEAAPIFREAVELGITLWDTANVYSAGSSEEIVGRAIKKYSRREDVVLATKVNGRMHGGPGGAGLSRKAIMEQIDASLRRLGTDYVDLYQIHRFDDSTPVEETMEALHDVRKVGKVRYIGASSMWVWQFCKMQHAAELGGWSKFVSMQDQYNLLMREEEREMFPALDDQGVGALAWSPLARGRLARPWGKITDRTQDDAFAETLYQQHDDNIVNSLEAVARIRGISMAQVAIAWTLRHPVVTSAIVGARSASQLREAVAALNLTLTDDEVAQLEAHYSPREPTGL